MSTISKSYTAREARARFSDAMGEVQYGGERVGITKNGRLAGVLISPEDFEMLEELEMAADVAAFDRAKAEDDGTRVSFKDLRSDLGL
ncbi:type II toxin-antitoxin system Phd/YefM family antitoxin [Stackebrandtia soli]|uniref:type II toxin-antitoxin system Phd/YefM family antitoxin n=1 Tax=Stackebrandtia soli TaxID=1892856 RepID=UPI0039E9C94F